ncbi:anhydro-N-acetylmuramic acid kinase [soil metagenome]
MRILGFMSGTSLDAVDMAILETDGLAIQGFGPCGERKLSDETRAIVLKATNDAKTWPPGAQEPESFAPAARAVALEHLAAARAFLDREGIDPSSLDLVGFHGQTVFHERPNAQRIGRTVQLGDGALLAQGLGVPVALDFRSADVAAGGQGAPLAPIYHAARAHASGLAPPTAVLNLGGVGNITLLAPDVADLQAFDTGPANGMIDLWVQGRTDGRFDAGGRLAEAGKVDEAVLALLLSHAYFADAGPKSLDRYDFSLDAVEHLSLKDGAATLTAFAARAVGLGVAACRQAPSALIICGGGRHNPALIAAIRACVTAKVLTAEDVGWRGDAIEAEAFAYLAARCRKGLPISFPGTTGVSAPMTGGRIVEPA